MCWFEIAYVVEEEARRAVTQFADEPSDRLDVLLADTLHQCLDLFLRGSTPADQLRMHQVHVVFPATV